MGNLAKLPLDDVEQGVVVEMVVVDLGAEEQLALGLELVVQAAAAAAAARRRRRGVALGGGRLRVGIGVAASRAGHALRVPVTVRLVRTWSLDG